MKAFKVIVVNLVVLLVAPRSFAAGTTTWYGLNLAEARTLTALPADVRQALSADGTGTTGIAERGAKFNATDVLDSTLPRRRFVIAGVDGESALVAIEQGGRGRHVDAFLIVMERGNPVIKDQWPLKNTPKTMAALIEAVETDGKPGVRTRKEAERVAKEYFKLHVGCGAYSGISESSGAWSVEGKFGFAGTPIEGFTIDKETGRISSPIGPSYADEAEMKRVRRHPLK